MNKYQEAIKAIKSNYPPENYTMLREALNISMDLLEKATPKKPSMNVFNAWCPNCGEALGKKFAENGLKGRMGTQYCPNCGQALDWSKGGIEQ